MRTVLDIDDDMLQAAKELARRDGSTVGRVLSELARRGLNPQTPVGKRRSLTRGGVPVLPSRGEIVTLGKVRKLMDEQEV